MGIATLSAQRDFQFRIAPESIDWTYTLNTSVTNTYGGRVVQILSVNINTLSVQCVSGRGGIAYLRSVADFFREMLLWQRDTQNTALFTYAPKDYRLKVYGSSMSVSDRLENVTYPFAMTFEVQQDLVGVVKTGIIKAELAKLNDGIGYTKNQYNDPDNPANATQPTSATQ